MFLLSLWLLTEPMALHGSVEEQGLNQLCCSHFLPFPSCQAEACEGAAPTEWRQPGPSCLSGPALLNRGPCLALTLGIRR